MSDAAIRFRRCVAQGRPAILKLATADLIQALPHMAPFDLVNSLRIAPNGSPAIQAIVSEVTGRGNFKNFNPTDLTIFLSAIAKSNAKFPLGNVVPTLTRLGTAYRTSDLLTSLWAISRLTNDKLILMQCLSLVSALFRNQPDRYAEISLVNFTQVLHALSKCPEASLTDDFVTQLCLAVIPKLNQLDDQALPFVLAVLAKVKARDLQILTPFFATVNAELLARDSMPPKLFVDSVRALGRLRQLDRPVLERRLGRIPLNALNSIQLRGLQNACVSVGLPSP